MGSGTKDPEITRLKKIDSDREGLLVKLSGGEYAKDENQKKKKKAAAVIEFQCDRERSGLEGLQTGDEDEGTSSTQTVVRRDDDEGEDGGDDDDGRSLKFVSFGPGDDDNYILKLDWKTKYACDDYLKEKQEEEAGGHWGFFTWLIIM